MGMDVYGSAPKSEKGEYFRSSIWTWPTILDAIAETGVLPAELVEHMAYNDGAGPDAEQSIALADALDAKLASLSPGGTFISEDSEYAKIGTATVATEMLKILTDSGEYSSIKSGSSEDSSAQFAADVEFIREFSEFCRESGGFAVW